MRHRMFQLMTCNAGGLLLPTTAVKGPEEPQPRLASETPGPWGSCLPQKTPVPMVAETLFVHCPPKADSTKGDVRDATSIPRAVPCRLPATAGDRSSQPRWHDLRAGGFARTE